MKDQNQTSLRSKTIARGSIQQSSQQVISKSSKRSGKSQKQPQKAGRSVLQQSGQKKQSSSVTKTKQEGNEEIGSQHSHESAPVQGQVEEEEEEIPQYQGFKANSDSPTNQQQQIKGKDILEEMGENPQKKQTKNKRNFEFLLEVREKAQKEQNQEEDQEVQEEVQEEEEQQNSENVRSPKFSVSDDSMIAELDQIEENKEIVPKFEGERKYYTLAEDLYVIALVKRWQKERSKGNPFQERYIENYTKIRGRKCEGIRDRYKRFLKNLTQENVAECRKALNELGPNSFIHFTKENVNGKNIRNFKGVFKEPASVQNSVKDPEIKEKLKQNLSRAKRKNNIDQTDSGKKKDKKKKKKDSDSEARLERQLIYDDKSNINNLKKRLYTEIQLEEKEEGEKDKEVEREVVEPKRTEKKKSIQKDEGIQVYEVELSGMKQEYGTPSNTRRIVQQQQQTTSNKKKVKQIPLKERVKWIEQFDREDRLREEIQPIKRTRVQLRNKKLRSLVQNNYSIQTVLLNERFASSNDTINNIKGYQQQQQYLKHLRFKGYSIGDRDIEIESKTTPILKEKLHFYAKKYGKDSNTVLKDLTSVSGDFKLLQQLYEFNDSYHAWLPQEDDILYESQPYDEEFQVLLHNKGEDSVRKRIIFLGINKQF